MSRIIAFTLGQRVRIVPEADCLAPPPPTRTQELLAGRTGRVVRLRYGDDRAWVEMDCELPAELRVFADAPRIRALVLDISEVELA